MAVAVAVAVAVVVAHSFRLNSPEASLKKPPRCPHQNPGILIQPTSILNPTSFALNAHAAAPHNARGCGGQASSRHIAVLSGSNRGLELRPTCFAG